MSIDVFPAILNDHYDPTKRVLRLSEGVYDRPVSQLWELPVMNPDMPINMPTLMVADVENRDRPTGKYWKPVGPILFMVGLILAGMMGDFGYKHRDIGINYLQSYSGVLNYYPSSRAQCQPSRKRMDCIKRMDGWR